MGDATEPEFVLLFDGVCAFCNRALQAVLRHDRRGTLKFATLQGEYGRAAVARHPHLAGRDTLVVLERPAGGGPERALIYSRAALRIARYLGGWWRLALIAYLIPGPLRDLAYRLFARSRYRLFGKYKTCMIPTPAVRARFLDVG